MVKQLDPATHTINFMKKILLITLTFLFLSSLAFGDGTLISWGMKDLKGMTKEKFDAAKTWSISEILQKNIEADSWPNAYLVAVGAQQKKDSIVDQLIEQLENGTITRLTLTSRLIIWERILLGDILFEGKGLQLDNDVFSVAGRANWMLRNITGKNFGLIKPNSTAADLAALRSKWLQWRAGKNVDEYKDLYEAKEKGLEEIHSLVAFEALIYSLKPSEEKNLLTKNCLKNVYGLDEMPKEKGSSSYCNPDTYTFSYVGMLIGEKTFDESKNYEWWVKWWNENKQYLTWNKEKGIFEVVK